jgi:hypothetical protein
MEIDEATFQRNWRTTLAVCLAYVAILGLFFVVAVYHVAWVAPDASQAKAHPNAPSVQLAKGNSRQPLARPK